MSYSSVMVRLFENKGRLEVKVTVLPPPPQAGYWDGKGLYIAGIFNK